MSLYSGVCDFRDSLSINFNDDFNDFMTRTGGVIEVMTTKSGQYRKVTIHNPSDLIPYYPYEVTMAGYGKETACIYLSACSYLEEQRKRYDELNANFQGEFKPFPYGHINDLEANLLLLYKLESAKPISEQKIV